MGFDSNIVLFDGFVIITSTEVSVSLKHDHETLCHLVAACRSEWVAQKVMRTYDFLALFCLDAPNLCTLCTFDGSRLDQLFLFRRLRRIHATGLGFLLVLGSHELEALIFEA
jgi:hypothetical protein